MKEDNNELENLYKKAAADFPLNTNSANWQTVLNQLEKEEDKKPFWLSKRNTALALLLLAFSMGSIIYYTYLKSNTTISTKNITTAKQFAEQKKLEQDITTAVIFFIEIVALFFKYS